MIPDLRLILCIESGPVRNLRTSGLNSGTVFSVQWLKPDQPNGVIRNYSIEIYNIGENCNVERGIESSKSVQAPSDDQMMISTTVGNLGNLFFITIAIL